MYHSCDEIRKQTRDLDTSMRKLVEYFKQRKDISKDETQILNRHIPKSRST